MGVVLGLLCFRPVSSANYAHGPHPWKAHILVNAPTARRLIEQTRVR